MDMFCNSSLYSIEVTKPVHWDYSKPKKQQSSPYKIINIYLLSAEDRKKIEPSEGVDVAV